MKVYRPKHWLQKVQWTEYLFGIFLRKIFSQLGSIHVTPGPFSIYRRDFFVKHGFYRHAYNTEDIEVALRIQTCNYEIENAHDAFVYTVGPSSFSGLWNQRLRWYHGFLRNTEDYNHLFSPKHGILGVFVLPTAFISIGLVIASLFYIVYQTLRHAVDRFIYLRATGFDLLSGKITFNAFFINVNSVAILGMIAFLIGLLVILTAKRVAGERSILRPYLWFMATYWMLYAVWWIGALYMRVTGKKVLWRHKSGN
jgi:cellulose synthase/poly-beta-1,6-N-acetylglucosamine synthase-like glycosyltransferase